MGEGVRPSFTIQRSRSFSHALYYRGAIRSTSDAGVIWECGHEHRHRVSTVADNGPMRCAQDEIERRASAVAPGAGGAE